MNSLIAIAISFIFYIPFLIAGIVVLVLSIKLMKRGIAALDKYISENS